MSDIDQKLKSINQGTLADLAAKHIGDLLLEMRMSKMSQLAAAFRNGKTDQVTLVAGLAGYCALEDLESEMKRRISRGEKASQDLHQSK